MKKVLFAIIGAILGISLSYYFQGEMGQRKMGGSIGEYMKHIDVIFQYGDESIVGKVVLSIFNLSLTNYTHIGIIHREKDGIQGSFNSKFFLRS